MTAQLTSDTHARNQALDIEGSYCVQAPAGSGKTELLTQRILKLLAHCQCPEEILAITFTRKAAAEMRQRLLGKLEEARGLDSTEIDLMPAHQAMTLRLAQAALRQDQALGWQLLDNTRRLRIMTIDGFNSFITAQLPVVANFGAQAEISEDMQPYYQEAAQTTLAQLDDADSAADDIALLLRHHHNNLNGLQNLLAGLLAKRDQWLANIVAASADDAAARKILEDNLAELVDAQLAETATRLAPHAALLCSVLNQARDHLATSGADNPYHAWPESGLPAASAEQLQAWQAISALCLTKSKSGDWRKRLAASEGFPAPSSAKGSDKETLAAHKEVGQQLLAELASDPGMLPLLQLLRQLPASRYRDSQWQVLAALTRVLRLLAANLTLVLRRHGVADYVQVSTAALTALGDEDDPADLALRLDYRIRHILVDEFQDTSSQQMQLLRKLTGGWSMGDGRSLFIVGDGMQSCYAFRNANVGLFLAARDQGIGDVRLASLQLRANFRSHSAVVRWVNQVFGQAFPGQDDIGRGAVRYAASEAVHPDQEDSGVSTLMLVSDREQDDLDSHDESWAEARQVAALVQQLRERHPQRGIAILVRSRGHLRDIVPALREAGLRWHASEIDPLLSYPAIMDLLNLCKALLNPADITAWFAILRAPWAGLTMADILDLGLRARTLGCLPWQVLQDCASKALVSADGRARLTRIVPVLAAARKRRGRQPLRAWLEQTWIELGGPATLPPNLEAANLESFFQLLEKHENATDIVDIHRFEQALEARYGNQVVGEANAVQVMTLHKAKGLEFDYVILPGLHRGNRQDDKPLLSWKEHIDRHGEARLLMALPAPRGEEEDAVYAYLDSEAGERGKLEDTRLLYIGVTRAVRHAWLLGVVRRGKDGDIKSPGDNTLLARVWQALNSGDIADTVQWHPVEAAREAKEPDTTPLYRSWRLPADWQHPSLEPALVVEPDAEPEAPVDAEHKHQLEKTRGKILHHCLQLAVTHGLCLDPLPPHLLTRWRRRLAPLCPDAEALEQALQGLRQELRQCLEHPRGAWLLDPSHQDSRCEVALSDFRHGLRREYVVDRTFIDGDGTRWIIDYKSTRPAFGQSLSDFLALQAQQHHSQLLQYGALFRVMEDRPQRLALFFSAIPEWLELPAGEVAG